MVGTFAIIAVFIACSSGFGAAFTGISSVFR